MEDLLIVAGMLDDSSCAGFAEGFVECEDSARRACDAEATRERTWPRRKPSCIAIAAPEACSDVSICISFASSPGNLSAQVFATSWGGTRYGGDDLIVDKSNISELRLWSSESL